MKIRFLLAGLLATANFCFGRDEVIFQVKQGAHMLLSLKANRLYVSNCRDSREGNSFEEEFCVLSGAALPNDEKDMQYSVLANRLRGGKIIEAWVKDKQVYSRNNNISSDALGKFSANANEILFALEGTGPFSDFLLCIQRFLGIEPMRFFVPYGPRGIDGMRLIYIHPEDY
jgi:hypothetical protein